MLTQTKVCLSNSETIDMQNTNDIQVLNTCSLYMLAEHVTTRRKKKQYLRSTSRAYANLLQIHVKKKGLKSHVASNSLPFMLTWTDALASESNVSNNAITHALHRYGEVGSHNFV